jgi:hypothetical protein
VVLFLRFSVAIPKSDRVNTRFLKRGCSCFCLNVRHLRSSRVCSKVIGVSPGHCDNAEVSNRNNTSVSGFALEQNASAPERSGFDPEENESAPEPTRFAPELIRFALEQNGFAPELSRSDS